MKDYEKWLSDVPGKNFRADLGAAERQDLRGHLDRAGVQHIVLRGAQMKTVPALFCEFSRQFAFPNYFGNNWDALDECICDLDWLPGEGYCVFIDEAGEVLSREPPGALDTLLRVLSRACSEWGSAVDQGESWDRPARPFNVIFNRPSAAQGALNALPSMPSSGT